MTFSVYGMFTATVFLVALVSEWSRQESLAAALGFLLVKFLLLSLLVHGLLGHPSAPAATLGVQAAASLATHRLLGRYRPNPGPGSRSGRRRKPGHGRPS